MSSSPPSKSVPALVWSVTSSLHSLQFLTNFLDFFLANLIIGLGPILCPGLSGSPDAYQPLAQPPGQPAPLVPMSTLTHPELLVLAPRYVSRQTVVWPVDLSRFQSVWLLFPSYSHVTSPLPCQPQNSDHDTLDAYGQSFSSASFLPVDQRVTAHLVQTDMGKCPHWL